MSIFPIDISWIKGILVNISIAWILLIRLVAIRRRLPVEPLLGDAPSIYELLILVCYRLLISSYISAIYDFCRYVKLKVWNLCGFPLDWIYWFHGSLTNISLILRWYCQFIRRCIAASMAFERCPILWINSFQVVSFCRLDNSKIIAVINEIDFRIDLTQVLVRHRLLSRKSVAHDPVIYDGTDVVWFHFEKLTLIWCQFASLLFRTELRPYRQ